MMFIFRPKRFNWWNWKTILQASIHNELRANIHFTCKGIRNSSKGFDHSGLENPTVATRKSQTEPKPQKISQG